MSIDNNQDTELKTDLIEGIKLSQFVLYYQPQYNLATSTFEGVEALIRWQHPRRGLLLPKEFIALAESNGFIQVIGEWVLKTACEQTKLWQDQGLPPIRMAVNVSERQLKHKDFVESVMNILNKTHLKSKYLELEINENTIINDDDKKVIRILNRLKKLGMQISLDDFGTGFSSLKYLKQFPIDRIKIDKSYIENMLTNHDDAAIVHAMINLARDMNIHVLAEGVENLKQLQAITKQADIEIQGYYFSEALPADEVENLLRAQANFNR